MTRYRVIPGASFQFWEWGEFTAFYHRLSGRTHCVDPLSAAVLRGLIAAPADLVALSDHVANEIAIEKDATFDSYMVQAVQQFLDLGLIECDD